MTRKANTYFGYLFFFALLLLIALTLIGPSESIRVRGKFDRFGKTKKRVNLGHYRTPQSMNYYLNNGGAKIVKASHFETDYELGKKVVFFCTAVGDPTPRITWFKEGVEIFDHSWFLVHEWISGNKIKSKMEIDPATQADRGEYECLADNIYAFDRRRFRTDYIEMD